MRIPSIWHGHVFGYMTKPQHMNTNSETIAVTEDTSTSAALNPAKPWWAVRPALLIMLATVLGVLGVVLGCPVLVDQTLAVML